MATSHIGLREYITEKHVPHISLLSHGLRNKKTADFVGQNTAQLQHMVEASGYETYIYEQCETPAKAQKKMENVWRLLEMDRAPLTKNPDHSLTDIINKLILLDILETGRRTKQGATCNS